MRILHVLSSSGFYGAESMAAELIRQLNRRGLVCHVGVFDNAGRGDRQAIGATQTPADRSLIIECRSQFDGRAVQALADYTREHRIDIVHSHKEKTTFHALFARRRAPFGLLTTHHNWLTDDWKQRLYGMIDKRVSAFCDARVGVSQPVVAELHRHGRRQTVHYIPNGVDPGHFARRNERARARTALGLGDLPVLGFVGRISAMKGLHTLFDAVAQIGFPVQLLLAGDGDERPALERKAQSLEMADRVKFLGRCADPRVAYEAMDLCVLPSFEEAFPMVLLEAMACGVPVLATRVGDVPVIVEEDVTGWIVPPADVGALRDSIQRLARDEVRLRQAGSLARERVSSTFSSALMAERYASVYERVLETRAQKAPAPGRQALRGSGQD